MEANSLRFQNAGCFYSIRIRTAQKKFRQRSTTNNSDLLCSRWMPGAKSIAYIISFDPHISPMK